MNYGFAFFPGQGAQAPGMGKDLYENSQAAKLVFEEASEGAGLDVAKLCFESDKATLSRTENSQIAIFTHSMAAWAALKEAGVEFKAAAGFSLGEYTALAAAGVVSLADGVKIVSMRGKLMQQAADSIDGGMAAILGLEDSVIEEACAKVTSGVVRPVNYNCPGQLVIAGEKAALAEAIENCKAAGARRALPLAVSGAFHTPLMAKAAAELRTYVADFIFFEFVDAESKHFLRGVGNGKQGFGRFVDAFVGGLCGQNDRYQQRVGVLVVEFAARIGIVLIEDVHNLHNFFFAAHYAFTPPAPAALGALSSSGQLPSPHRRWIFTPTSTARFTTAPTCRHISSSIM